MASKEAEKVTKLMIGKDLDAEVMPHIVDEVMLPALRAATVKGRCLAIYQLADRDGHTGEWVQSEIRRTMNGEDLAESGVGPLHRMAPHAAMDALVDLRHDDKLARRTGLSCSPPPAYI